jgi:hypothetical protein
MKKILKALLIIPSYQKQLESYLLKKLLKMIALLFAVLAVLTLVWMYPL